MEKHTPYGHSDWQIACVDYGHGEIIKKNSMVGRISPFPSKPWRQQQQMKQSHPVFHLPIKNKLPITQNVHLLTPHFTQLLWKALRRCQKNWFILHSPWTDGPAKYTNYTTWLTPKRPTSCNLQVLALKKIKNKNQQNDKKRDGKNNGNKECVSATVGERKAQHLIAWLQFMSLFRNWQVTHKWTRTALRSTFREAQENVPVPTWIRRLYLR